MQTPHGRVATTTAEQKW